MSRNATLPNEFYFAVTDYPEEGVVIHLSMIADPDFDGCIDDAIVDLLPRNSDSSEVYEHHECAYKINGRTKNDVKIEMQSLGFVYSSEFEQLI